MQFARHEAGVEVGAEVVVEVEAGLASAFGEARLFGSAAVHRRVGTARRAVA